MTRTPRELSVNAPRFQRLPATIDLAAMERRILDRWDADGVFAESLAQREGAERWTFFEGPPTANGVPGAHHIEARAFKDIFPRFQTMRGRYVPRIAGWDCHGLPVEIAVERELGLSGKGEIEAFGVAEFNQRCRESVQRHVGEFAELTRRMGYWVDLDDAYWTMDADYIESVWWSLAEIDRRGLLVRDHRVTPYCGRCGTGLSDHEVAQGYEDVVDRSIFVRFPLSSGPLAGRADLLVWTTTPWTLTANTAAAVNPDATYVLVHQPGSSRPLVMADALVDRLVSGGGAFADVVRDSAEPAYSGSQLAGWRYDRPHVGVDIDGAGVVLTADFVTTTDGSGIVHLAPAFGADDMAAIRAAGLPVVNPVGTDGRFSEDVPLVAGMWFRDANAPIIDALRDAGILVADVPFEHSYPHCWRCHEPLLYYALPAWYIRTTQIADELLAENEATNWYPDSVKWGRYGDWLRNNVDWALSRSRYWGTPLPVWQCDAEHRVVVSSRAHLGELTGCDQSELDPHRPFVDTVTFACPTCGEEMRRVPEVIDVWYDSGAMPFAQFGYPAKGADDFTAAYPARYICEAIDQTRGWFYSLMAIGTLVFGRSSYENVVCLGHILADDGRKMSKHLGNVLEPMSLLDRHGADAVRWFMLCSGSPWNSRRVGHAGLEDVVRKVVLAFWNAAAFFTLYAETNDWRPADGDLDGATVLDRWILGRADAVVRAVTDELERFDTAKAGRELVAFLDDLSNWYIRRSRRRFWDGDPAALATLHDIVHRFCRVLAPFMPFVTEEIWSAVRRADDPLSVHLSDWPDATSTATAELDAPMAVVRRVVELGRSARASAKVKTRQPLRKALVGGPDWSTLSADLVAEVADELNVLTVEPLGVAAGLTDVSVKPNFRTLGAKHGKAVQDIAAAVRSADPVELASAAAAGTASVDVGGVAIALDQDDLVVTETPREGWAVAASGNDTVALDLAVDDELAQLGLARDAVRVIQDARKQSGFDVSDRIELWWESDDAVLAAAIEAQSQQIAAEVLATGFARGPGPGGAPSVEGGGLHLVLRVVG